MCLGLGLCRYSATTVLALLQEVTHSAEVNMDWNALVKNTSTGISDAREYQMLWRHLAYHHTLLHKFDHGAQPLVSHSATFISFFFFLGIQVSNCIGIQSVYVHTKFVKKLHTLADC